MFIRNASAIKFHHIEFGTVVGASVVKHATIHGVLVPAFDGLTDTGAIQLLSCGDLELGGRVGE